MKQSDYISLSYPLGPTVCPEGTNFSLFSAHATKVEIVLFDDLTNTDLNRVISLDPVCNKTSHYWHIFIPGVTHGQLYGYRVYGPQDPQNGQRFDPGKILLDPYAKVFMSAQAAAERKLRNLETTPLHP